MKCLLGCVDTGETKPEKKARIAAARKVVNEEAHRVAVESWDPQKQSGATEDPYKTLFVAKINYDTPEAKLKREFEEFGAIKSLRVVHSSTSGKPRGYAFVEYHSSRDMKSASPPAPSTCVRAKLR